MRVTAPILLRTMGTMIRERFICDYYDNSDYSEVKCFALDFLQYPDMKLKITYYEDSDEELLAPYMYDFDNSDFGAQPFDHGSDNEFGPEPEDYVSPTPIESRFYEEISEYDLEVEREREQERQEELRAERESPLVTRFDIMLSMLEEEQFDPELCLEVLETDPYLLRCIENQTEEMCEMAVRSNIRTLKYVRRQSLRICLLAIERNPKAIRYVHNPTMVALYYLGKGLGKSLV